MTPTNAAGKWEWAVKVSVTNLAGQWTRISASLRAAHGLLLFCLLPAFLLAQTSSSDSPIPILSGSAGYFNFVTAGQNQLNAQVNPVLLLALGIIGSWNPEQSLRERFSVRPMAALTAVR